PGAHLAQQLLAFGRRLAPGHDRLPRGSAPPRRQRKPGSDPRGAGAAGGLPRGTAWRAGQRGLILGVCLPRGPGLPGRLPAAGWEWIALSWGGIWTRGRGWTRRSRPYARRQEGL